MAYLVTLEIDENITPIPPQAKTRNGTDGILFKNVTAMVSSRTRPKPRPASTRRPRFSFHIFNCQKTDTTTPTRGNIPELKTPRLKPLKQSRKCGFYENRETHPGNPKSKTRANPGAACDARRPR